MDALSYFNSNLDYFKKEIAKIVSFKSISTDPEYKQDVLHASEWVREKLASLGFTIKVIRTSSNPIILAKRIADPAYKTVLLYGHYDVQPVAPIADWKSDPFIVDERDEKLFGRGIMDNKGQFMMHISAIESLQKSNTNIPLNIKFIIEGDEETGSADLDSTIRDNADFLQADFALISDGEIIGDDIPVIEASFRGVLNLELTLTGPKEDLHSGVAGGAIANPAFELASLIAKFYDENYQVRIPHFYDDVVKITNEEKDILQIKTGTDEDFLKLTGSPMLIGEKGYTRFERTGLRPTLQVTGLNSGYTGVGFKNIVPSKANAKFNFRLAANQNPEKIYNAFVQFIKDNISPAVNYEISRPDMVSPVKVSIDNEYMQHARKLLTTIYGHEAEINFVGGTLPVVNAIKEYINIPILSIPLSQEDCGMHSPNERLTLMAFKRGVAFSIQFLNSFMN